MKKWEYLQVNHPNQEQLEMFGGLGWELIWVIVYELLPNIFIFKREIQ